MTQVSSESNGTDHPTPRSSNGVITSSKGFTIDPEIVPWSCRGSYMAIACLGGQNGTLTPRKDLGQVYILNHRYPAGVPLLSIRPVDSVPTSAPTGFPTTSSGYTVSAQPGLLTFEKDGIVGLEMTWGGVGTLKLRGRGIVQMDTDGGLGVDSWRNWLYRLPPSSEGPASTAELAYTPNAMIRVDVHRGKMILQNDAPYDFNFKDLNRRIVVVPEEEKVETGENEGHEEGDWDWELEITEVDLTAVKSNQMEERANGHDSGHNMGSINGHGSKPAENFDTSVKKIQDEFDKYTKSLCPWSKVTAADQLAAYVMYTSTVRAEGFLTNEAVLMSKLWMNKVWSWDNCFNGLALAADSVSRSLDQILLPFEHITREGRLPDSLTPYEGLYDYTKPPIYGFTFFTLLSLLDPKSTIANPSFETIPHDRLKDIYTKVGRFTNFWFNSRSTTVSDLPYYVHGNDSGWDNATCYDNQTVCVSPDLAAFLIVQCDFLAKLGDHLGEVTDRWSKLRDRTSCAIVNELWDQQKSTFLFKDAYDGHTWSSTSLLQYVPVVASAYLPKNVVGKLKQGLREHLTEWGLATELPTSKLYEPDGYWRGPIWAPPTIIIEWGLRLAGETHLADDISKRFIRLCEASGFAENYDAKTGGGNRDLSYTWSASTYLVLRRQAEQRGA